MGQDMIYCSFHLCTISRYINYLIVIEYTAVFLENVLKSAAIFDLLAVTALRGVVPIPVDGEHCSIPKELEEFIVKCFVN